MPKTKAGIAPRKPVFYNDWPKCDNGHRVNPNWPIRRTIKVCPKCGLAMTQPETDIPATMPAPSPGGTDEHTVRSERVSGTSTIKPGDGTSDRSSDRGDTDESLDDPVRPGTPATPAETPRPGQPALALDAAHKAGEWDIPLADATDEVLGPVTIPDTPEALIAPSGGSNIEERLDRLPQHGFAGSLTLAHKRQLAKQVSHVTYRILDTIITIINSYGGRPQAIPADEIVAVTGAAQSTVYRSTKELATLGYLSRYQAGKRTGAGGHKLKPTIYGLGHNLTTTPYDDKAHGDRMTTKHTTVRAQATAPSDDRAHHKKVDTSKREIDSKPQGSDQSPNPAATSTQTLIKRTQPGTCNVPDCDHDTEQDDNGKYFPRCKCCQFGDGCHIVPQHTYNTGVPRTLPPNTPGEYPCHTCGQLTAQVPGGNCGPCLKLVQHQTGIKTIKTTESTETTDQPTTFASKEAQLAHYLKRYGDRAKALIQ